MIAPLSNFNNLCNTIRAKSIRDINKGLPNNRLVKWQKMLTAILETELAMHKVRSALNLLKTVPSKDTLNAFSMSEGAWIEYHYTTWSFWSFSLLEREKSLVKQVVRNLVKPSNPQYEEIENTLLKSVEVQSCKISKVRHPLAHTGKGGTIDEVINATELWKDFVILPSPTDYNEILASCVPYRRRWHYFLHEVSIWLVAEIERVCGELNQHIDWNNV